MCQFDYYIVNERYRPNIRERLCKENRRAGPKEILRYLRQDRIDQNAERFRICGSSDVMKRFVSLADAREAADKTNKQPAL